MTRRRRHRLKPDMAGTFYEGYMRGSGAGFRLERIREAACKRRAQLAVLWLGLLFGLPVVTTLCAYLWHMAIIAVLNQ